MKENLTALMSAFLRARHFKRNDYAVFCGKHAFELLGDDYYSIESELKKGIRFLRPDFEGSHFEIGDDALDAVLNATLSGAVLARSAFFERAFNCEKLLGAKQAVILGAGYDSFSLSADNDITVFEIDRETLFCDKLERAKKAGLSFGENVFFLPLDLEKKQSFSAIGANAAFKKDEKTVFAALGVLEYLSHDGLLNMLSGISEIACEGSVVVFDFSEPCEETKEEKMALLAGEAMNCGISQERLMKLLEDFGFITAECLDGEELTREFFTKYNALYPEKKLSCPKNVKCICAVKKY